MRTANEIRNYIQEKIALKQDSDRILNHWNVQIYLHGPIAMNISEEGNIILKIEGTDTGILNFYLPDQETDSKINYRKCCSLKGEEPITKLLEVFKEEKQTEHVLASLLLLS